MALVGTYDIYTPVYSETEFTYTSLSVPVDVDVDDPYYDHRGTTIIQSQSSVDHYDTSSVTGYVSVYQYTYFKKEVDAEGYDALAVWWNLYGNEASRSADYNNHISQHTDTFVATLQPGEDLRDKAYTLLKSQSGWANMADV